MSVCLFVTAQEMAGTTGKSDIDNVDLLLLEEVEFAEVREEFTEGPDLMPEAKLAKLVFTLD